MLREIKNVRKIPDEPMRRWFTDEEMDLMVWYSEGEIISFQLCYNKQSAEKAVSWAVGNELVHESVDSGESRYGHYKATPILISHRSYDLEAIRAGFFKNSAKLSDVNLRNLVLKYLHQ